MGNERFTVPEVLFSPQDIGINEAGIPEMLTQVVGKCPKQFESLLYENIIIGGGNTMYPGFKERLENDLQSLKPIDSTVNVYDAKEPQHAAWKGLRLFCQNKQNFEEYVVTRREYNEEGFRVLKKFYL